MTTPNKLKDFLRRKKSEVILLGSVIAGGVMIWAQLGRQSTVTYFWGAVAGFFCLLWLVSQEQDPPKTKEPFREGNMVVMPEVEIPSDKIDPGNIPAPESHRAGSTNPFLPTDAQRFTSSLMTVLGMPADSDGRIPVNKETLSELFNLGKHLAEELDRVEGTGMMIGVDFGAEGKTAMVIRRSTAAVEDDARKLYEKIRDNKPATRSWDELPDVERWIWRRVVRLAAQGRERLKAHMLDEPAITKAESAQRACQKAADDHYDDTGWAEPMTEAVEAAFDYAVEELNY